MQPACSKEDNYTIPDGFVDLPQRNDSLFFMNESSDEADAGAEAHSVITKEALNLFAWEEKAIESQNSALHFRENPLCMNNYVELNQRYHIEPTI